MIGTRSYRNPESDNRTKSRPNAQADEAPEYNWHLSQSTNNRT